MMLLTVHNLAEKYGLLPSEIMDRATTFDLHCLDLNARYTRYQQEQEERRQGKKSTPQLTEQEMKSMIERVKNKERG